MMKSSGQDGNEILAGYYCATRRRKEISDRLQASFDRIRAEDLTLELEENASAQSSGQDICSMNFGRYEGEVRKLEEDVAKYVGPHFTKFYRTLQGHCGKLQMDLDALDCSGREDIRRKRKEIIIKIDQLARKLAQGAHSDGKSCDDCEIKNY